MAAIDGTKMSSAVVGRFVAASAVALVIGGVGGYLFRGLTVPLPAPAHPAALQTVKSPAGLPLWVQRYTEPVPASQFHVDQFIEDLSYAPHAELPGWVDNYLMPAAAPQFKVDQLIEELSYARVAELPAWVQPYLAPARATQFKVDAFIESLS